MAIELTKNREQILGIMQALLASGHYTEIRAEEDGTNPEPRLQRIDNGKDWKDDGFNRRFSAICVLDAIDLWEELQKEIDKQEQE